MGVCASCGNDYDKSFEITVANGAKFVFDSFECAIRLIAIECDHCGCKILGHGMESGGVYYYCAHCAAQAGERRLKDRAT